MFPATLKHGRKIYANEADFVGRRPSGVRAVGAVAHGEGISATFPPSSIVTAEVNGAPTNIPRTLPIDLIDLTAAV